MTSSNAIPSEESTMSINIDSQGGVTHIGANGYDLDRMASQGDSIMSEGISVLYQFMTLFTDLAQGKYDQMKAKADRARNSQQVANQIDAIIAKFKKRAIPAIFRPMCSSICAITTSISRYKTTVKTPPATSTAT
ncbi:hypothetical protein O0544_01900 [Edwardsiella anguillarum]|nr:hypothetical protein [Edwardsiella anguillarum]